MIKAWTNKIICPVRKKPIGRKFTVSNGRIEYTAEFKKTTIRISKSSVHELPIKIIADDPLGRGSITKKRQIKTSSQYIWTKLYHWRKPPKAQIPKEEDDNS